MNSNKSINFVILGLFTLGITMGISYAAEYTSADKEIARIQQQYAADFSDDKKLVGAAHNVFAGKVIKKTGTHERGIGPETQFKVRVVDNIKGELKGTVTVNQRGGYKDGVLYVVGGGDVVSASQETGYLLQPGSTYLFATRYNEQRDWHTMNPHPAGSKKLTNDASLSNAQLQTVVENDVRVNKLQQAYPNEVLLPADVQRGNARNSYTDRQ